MCIHNIIGQQSHGFYVVFTRKYSYMIQSTQESVNKTQGIFSISIVLGITIILLPIETELSELAKAINKTEDHS